MTFGIRQILSYSSEKFLRAPRRNKKRTRSEIEFSASDVRKADQEEQLWNGLPRSLKRFP